MSGEEPTGAPLLGAHVSIAGGLERAPGRGGSLGANVIQIFTKPVQRWAEPRVSHETARAFRAALEEHAIEVAGAHDSYLINLASPDPALHRRSLDSFCRELERCDRLKLDFLVSHPGNATDGDRKAGVRRNGSAIRTALEATGSDTPILLEVTAGQGRALGASFEELATIIESAGSPWRDRLGVCLDTAHLHGAGYDLVNDYESVMQDLDRILGIERVRLLHLNDSKVSLGSRVDRHQHIGEGRLGLSPFRALMRDTRFRTVPKVIETPKDSDAERLDRRNLQRLHRCLRD